VLGIVLGDLMEKGFRRGLVLSDGELGPFFTRPISAVLWISILLVILLKFPVVTRLLGRMKRRAAPPLQPLTDIGSPASWKPFAWA
jgi:putative tricarboxylic transport membrane protein